MNIKSKSKIGALQKTQTELEQKMKNSIYLIKSVVKVSPKKWNTKKENRLLGPRDWITQPKK